MALSRRADGELSWLWVPTLEMWGPRPTFYGLQLGLNDPFPLKNSLALSCYFGLQKYNRHIPSPRVFPALTCLSHPQWDTGTLLPTASSTFLFNRPPTSSTSCSQTCWNPDHLSLESALMVLLP